MKISTNLNPHGLNKVLSRHKKANRFKQIIDFFQSQVSQAKAFKVGEIEIDIYILGIVSDTYIIGLKTLSVET